MRTLHGPRTTTLSTQQRDATSSARQVSALDSETTTTSIDWWRYGRLGWFLVKTIVRLAWWDILFNRPMLGWLRTSPGPRWRGIACEFRVRAIEASGVLVKLGQFLSLRFDLLPPEVTQELAMLQDQMPALPFEAIVLAIEADLGRPLPECFAWIAPQPVGSASLAQVHLARLPSGEQVVVKVLRPGMSAQVEMDLRVIGLLICGLKRFRRLSGELDLDRLLEEFVSVTRRELNLIAEGTNAERFAGDFADDPLLYVPKVYWKYSGRHTLTLENVSYLRLNDRAALEAAGIDPSQVAHQLARIYLRQIFITYFIHADPHPGNLFVKPLPHPAEPGVQGFAPGERVPYQAGRPFQIVLIDFGMAIEIPPNERAWLRDFAIGLGTRNARRIVQAYATGGVLRPSADPQRVEQMTAALLEHAQDMLVGIMPDLRQPEIRHFFAEYEDLLHNYPFQMRIDLLFMYRALSVVSTVVKQLDPGFDLSAVAAPMTTQLLVQVWQRDMRAGWQALNKLGHLLATPPLQLDQVIDQAQKVFSTSTVFQYLVTPQRPAHTAPTERSVEDRRQVERLERSVKRLTWMMVVVCLLLAVMVWQMGGIIVSVLQTRGG